MDVGARLRDAREARGLSLDAVSRSTRVQPRILSAIETNDSIALPPRPYGRGFVRAYASEVGLDPDGTVREFFSQFAPPVDSPAGSETLTTFDGPRREASTRPWLWPVGGVFAYAAVGTLVVFAGRWALDGGGKPGAVPPQRASVRAGDPAPAQRASALVGNPGPAGRASMPGGNPAPLQRGNVRAGSPAPLQRAGARAGDPAPPAVGTIGGNVPAATAAVDQPSPAQPAPADSVTIALEAQGPAWVEASVDGQRTVYRLLQPGERVNLTGAREVSIRAGDAGALLWQVNGGPAKIMGQAGKIRTERVTRENANQVK